MKKRLTWLFVVLFLTVSIQIPATVKATSIAFAVSDRDVSPDKTPDLACIPMGDIKTIDVGRISNPEENIYVLNVSHNFVPRDENTSKNLKIAISYNGILAPGEDSVVTATVSSNVVGDYGGLVEFVPRVVGWDGSDSPVVPTGVIHCNFRILQLLPTVHIISPEPRTYYTNQIPLIFSVNVTAEWMEYILDQNAPVRIAGNTTLSGLSEGSHTVIVRVKEVGTHGSIGGDKVNFSVYSPTTIIFGILIALLILSTLLLVNIVKSRRKKRKQVKPHN